MVFSSASKQPGITRGQMVTIAILGIILVGVVALQLTPPSEDGFSEADPPPVGRRVLRRPVRKPTPGVSTHSASITTAWPEVSLEEVRAFNPFAVSAQLAPPPPPRIPTEPGETPQPLVVDDTAEREAADRAALIEEIRGSGVEVVVIGSGRRVANISGKLIRVGDLLRGFRVVEIQTDGIVIAERSAEGP